MSHLTLMPRLCSKVKIAQERTFELDVTNGLINKQRFDPRRVDILAKVGTVERWIINSSLPVGFTIQRR